MPIAAFSQSVEVFNQHGHAYRTGQEDSTATRQAEERVREEFKWILSDAMARHAQAVEIGSLIQELAGYAKQPVAFSDRIMQIARTLGV